MDKRADGADQSEAQVAMDLLASSWMKRTRAPSTTAVQPSRLPPKTYAIMAATSLLTFATLTTAYQMLIPHQLFA